MPDIEFTQYLMPDGRKDTVRIDRPDEVVAASEAIRAAGYSFGCEMLSDWKTISLTVENDDGDFDIEVCLNGPPVPEAVDRLIFRAAERLKTKTAA